MKIRLSLFCTALMVLLSANVADAQLLHNPGYGQGQAAFRAISGDLLQPGLPGRLWVEGNFADRGLGYSDSYITVGAKSRLFQDRFDGRWLVEGQVNRSIADDGGFFANIGLQRVFSIEAAQTDVSVGVFYDYDGDDQQLFSDSFHQIGISGAIKTPKWDLMGNGYLPVGTSDYTMGDPTGIDCFVGNNIALQAGIESALQGFDVTLRMRPRQLAFVNGTFDIGAYHYSSDLVNAFGGGRVRVGVQVLNGMIVSAEVNQDDRFDTTGVLQVGWIFGNHTSGYGNEWAGLARDLESTVRNDHIVRFSQDLIVAINPDTGLPYNVIHADNTAPALAGTGTAETPFATLAEAEAASAASDIIFVHGGDGTDTGYNAGITLKDNQYLLSNGGSQFIPLTDGSRLLLSGKPGDSQATISNPGGNEVVRLANNNTVGGLNIDATGAQFGIFGAGITDGQFNGNTISGATQDGIGLQNVNGDFAFNDNVIFNNQRDGIFINGAFDSTSRFTFNGNDVSNNGVDGIHLLNYDAQLVSLIDNITDGNGRHGVFLQNALNGAGTGNDISIVRHQSDSNGGDGIRIDTGSGNLEILSPTLTNNSGAGLTIRNWTDPLVGDRTLISGVNGTPGIFTGNGTGIQIDLDGTGLVQDVLITESRVDGNGRGILASVDGPGSIMNFNVIDMTSISNNDNEGIRMSVNDSGVMNSLIENTDPALPMPIINNNFNGGGSISYVLDGVGGNPASRINAIVRNVNADTNAAAPALQVRGVGNSVINLLVEDSTLRGGAGADISLDNNDNGLINRTYFDNVAIRGDVGILGSSNDGTRWDFALLNSNVQSNGILAGAAEVLDRTNPVIYTPYTDIVGDFGVFITANGQPFGAFDNLTRVTISNNVIRDFTFDGITLATTGDAQMLADIQANQIFNNGPGLNDDPNNDGVFEGPNSLAVNPLEFGFHDGLTIIADGNSTISARIDNNGFIDNFERGVRLTTLGQGTINATMVGNRLSNDIGGDNTNPANAILGQDIFDMTVDNAAGGNICIGLSNNTFRLAVDFAGNTPGINLGLDGASNGFTQADVFAPVTFVTFGLCDNLITAEELFFQINGGFPNPAH